MAYDSDRDVVVLFGGQDASGNVLDDTWEWDGTTWLQVFSPGGPPTPRMDHAMIYDAASGNTIMHGGRDGNGNVFATDSEKELEQPCVVSLLCKRRLFVEQLIEQFDRRESVGHPSPARLSGPDGSSSC